MKTHLIFILILIAIFGCNSTTPSTPEGGWKVVPVTDKFGDETGKAISGVFKGTFTNMIMTDADMKVVIGVYDDTTLYVQPYEYEDMLASFSRGGCNRSIQIKLADGSVISSPIFPGGCDNGYCQFVYDDERSLFNILMRETEPFKCVLGTEEAMYNFIVDPKGFKDTFEKIL